MNNKNRILPIILRTTRRAPWLSAALLLVILGAVAFSLIPPLVLEKIVDGLTQGGEIALTFAFLYFGVLALSGLFDSLKEMLITVFGQKITREVRHTMCAKLSRLPAGYFTANEPGVTVSRFVNDVDTLENLFASGIVGMFVDACKIVGILAVIFTKSTRLGILLLLTTPLLFLFTRAVQKRMLAAQLQNRVSVGKLNNHVPETIRNIRSIHIFRKERYMEKKYDDRIEESYRAVDKANFCDAIYSPVVNIVSAVIIAVMMILAATGGAAQSFFGLSVGAAVAIIAYVTKIFEPLESIGMEIQSVQSAAAGIRRIKELLNEQERPMPDSSLSYERLIATESKAVELNCVDFGYDSGKTVLNRLSLSVDAGESVTLAGRTGAGKSTIFKLLLGFYSPLSGTVKIFGTDAEKIPDNIKRHLFGYVEQSFRAVPGTVFDQIAVFDETISEESVKNAAGLVGIDEAIQALPSGYLTPYSEGLFSQGQRQLIAIARAVVADPAILLLDEITANLDRETEESVLIALKKAAECRTVISISHRLYEQTGGRIEQI